MTEVLVAIFGVVGTALGWWLGRHQERERWGREDRTRFHEERLRLYREYVQMSEQLETTARTWGIVRGGSPPPREGRWPTESEISEMFERDFMRLDGLRREIDLIGSPAIRVAARKVWEAVVPCGPRGHMQRPDGRLLVEARNSFMEAARCELGVA